MKKMIKESIRIVIYMILMLGEIIKYSIKNLILGSVFRKIGIIIIYAALGGICAFNKKVFLIIIGIFILGLFIAALSLRKTGKKLESGVNNSSCERKNNIPIPFFEGLSKEDAKEEYCRLMKQCHPDNGKFGDLAKTKEVATAYSQYIARFGR